MNTRFPSPGRGWNGCAPFFRCCEFGVHPSRSGTRARFVRKGNTLVVRFHCPLRKRPKPAPLRPVGDPDVFRDGEYVRVQLQWSRNSRDKAHWTVAFDGTRLGERGDRRIIPDASWRAEVSRGSRAWTAQLTVPLGMVSARRRRHLRISLFRCTASESITGWPTPFGSWLLPRQEGSVPLDCAPLNATRLQRRAACLRDGLNELLGSFPDGDPRWMERFRLLLRPDIDPRRLADIFHRRASASPPRSFLGKAAVEGPPNLDRARNLRCLASFDAGRTPEAFDRGEMFVNLAWIAVRDRDARLFARVQRSLDLALRKHPIQIGLQRLAPGSRWGNHIGVYTFGLMLRAAWVLSTWRPLDNRLVCRLYKLGHELFHFGIETIEQQYHWNHGVNWLDKMIEMGAMCREMREADLWVRLGWQHMRRALRAQILPDGISQELSSGYHYVTFYRLWEAMEACRDSGIAVPTAMLRWAERLFESHLAWLLPNGQPAGFGDGNDSLPEDGFIRQRLSDNPLNRLACERFGRHDLLCMVTGGARGTKPKFTDHAKRYAGVYAARTGWTNRDCGLIFDAGAFGRSHQHDDRLSFVYSYKGRCLLVDGLYGQVSASGISARSAQAHSTVMVDGFESDYLRDFSLWVNRERQRNRFERKGRLHYFEGRHRLRARDGSNQLIEIRRRNITQLDRFIWIIDDIQGEGVVDIRTQFVLPRGKVLVEKCAFRATSGKIDLAGVSLDGTRAQQERVQWPEGIGQRSIVQWATKQVRLPHRHSFLLIPFEDGHVRMPEAKPSLTGRTAQLALRWPDGSRQTIQW